MNKPRVLVLVLYAKNFQPLADVTLPNIKEYCKIHGYFCYSMVFDEYTSDFGFHKISMMQKIFDRGQADIIWSLDLDCLITNMNVKVESFVDPDYDMFITKDINGLNAGSFIVKNTENSRGLLKEIMIMQGSEDNEQNAIERIYSTPAEWRDDKIKVLPHPSINSYLYSYYGPHYGKIEYSETDILRQPTHEEGEWQSGDFMVHVPALPLELRIHILSNMEVVK